MREREREKEKERDRTTLGSYCRTGLLSFSRTCIVSPFFLKSGSFRKGMNAVHEREKERKRGDTRITRTCINTTCINTQALVSPLLLSHMHLGTPLFIAHASTHTQSPQKRRGRGREREAQRKRSTRHEEKEKRRHQDKEQRSESEAQRIRTMANTTCWFQSFYLRSAKRKRRASQRSF